MAKATVNLQPLATENSRPLAAGEFAGKIVRWGIQPLWLEKSQPQPISQLGHRMDDNDAMSDGKTPSGVSRESIGNQLVLGSSQPLPATGTVAASRGIFMPHFAKVLLNILRRKAPQVLLSQRR